MKIDGLFIRNLPKDYDNQLFVKAIVSVAKGLHKAAGWAVVLSRPLPAGLAPGGRSQVAFAVWEGSKQEVGSRKMRTGWTPLSLEGAR